MLILMNYIQIIIITLFIKMIDYNIKAHQIQDDKIVDLSLGPIFDSIYDISNIAIITSHTNIYHIPMFEFSSYGIIQIFEYEASFNSLHYHYSYLKLLHDWNAVHMSILLYHNLFFICTNSTNISHIGSLNFYSL